MAVPNDGQTIAVAWEDYVKTEPTEQIFQTFWMLENLRARGAMQKGEGTPIVGTIEYAENTTVRDIAEMDTIEPERIDIFDRYEYSWKQKAGLIVMSEFEKQVTMGGGGRFDLQAGKMENLKNSMMKQINADMYGDGTGSGGLQAHGLGLLVSSTPTTGTVGAINRATYTFWRNQQTSGAKTTTAFDNLKGSMRSIYNLCSSGVGKTTPEWASTDRTVFEGYESLSTTIERLNRTSPDDKLISGFKGDRVMFKDIPLAFDHAHTASVLYIMNSQNLQVRHMLWMKAFPPGTPVNQFIDVVKILTQWQMITDNPRRLGVVTAIT